MHKEFTPVAPENSQGIVSERFIVEDHELFDMDKVHEQLGFTRRDDGGFVCNRCTHDATPDTRTAVSIHNDEFGDTHAGPGQVNHAPIPFCESCDADKGPVLYGCVHIKNLFPTVDDPEGKQPHKVTELYLYRNPAEHIAATRS